MNPKVKDVKPGSDYTLVLAFSQDEFRSIITSDPDGYCVELYYNKNANDGMQTDTHPSRG